MWGPRQYQSTLTSVGADECFFPQPSPQRYCDARDTPFSQRQASPGSPGSPGFHCPDSPDSEYHDARDTPFSQRDNGELDDDLKIFDDELNALAIGNMSDRGPKRTPPTFSGPVFNLATQFATTPGNTSEGSKAPSPFCRGARKVIPVANVSTRFSNSSGDSCESGTPPRLLDMRRVIPVDRNSFQFYDSSSNTSGGDCSPLPAQSPCVKRVIPVDNTSFQCYNSSPSAPPLLRVVALPVANTPHQFSNSSGSTSGSPGSAPPPHSLGLRKVAPVSTPSADSDACCTPPSPLTNTSWSLSPPTLGLGKAKFESTPSPKSSVDSTPPPPSFGVTGRVSPVSTPETDTSVGWSLPPPTLGLRRAHFMSTPSPEASDGGTAPPPSQGMRRASPVANLSTCVNPIPPPTQPSIFAGCFPQSSPEWEGGVPAPTPHWPSSSEHSPTGQKGRSESFDDWFFTSAGGTILPPAQHDPQQSLAMTPFMPEVLPDIEEAIEMKPSELYRILPTPGDPKRTVKALERMMEIADKVIGWLRYISKCTQPRQQPMALAKAEMCGTLFLNIQQLFKDGIYDVDPKVFTISRVASESLAVATRRRDRSVGALAILARKLTFAARVLIQEIDEARLRLPTVRQRSQFDRTLRSIDLQDTPLPPDYLRARTC